MTPIETFFNSKLAEFKKQESELWQDWKDSGHHPEKFKSLLTSYRPLINRTVRQYSRVAAVPHEAVEAEVKKHFLNACKTFNPDSGAQLGTWVNWHLKKTKRYVDEYSNIGKIPEPRIALINKYKLAKDELFEHLNRLPTHQEVASHINTYYPSTKKISHKEIKNLSVELSRDDLSESGFDDGPGVFQSPKELEAIRLLRWSNKLNHEEKSVFDHVFGVHENDIFVEHHMKKPGDIARLTGFSNSKISRIRNSIADKVRQTVDVLE